MPRMCENGYQRTCYRTHRETGRLTEEEERDILHHYKVQAEDDARSKTRLHHGTPLDTPIYPVEPWTGAIDKPTSTSIQVVSTPSTLEDFHKSRVRSQASNGSSMFGHTAIKVEIKRSPSGGLASSSKSSRAQSTRGSGDQSVHTLKYGSRSTSTDNMHETNFSTEDEDDYSFSPNMSPASLKPPRSKEEAKRLQRISRVLDDMEADFSQNYTSMLVQYPNDQTHATFLSDNLSRSTSTGPSPTKASSKSRATDEDTEAIDVGIQSRHLKRPFHQQTGARLSPVPSLPKRDSDSLSAIHALLFSGPDSSPSTAIYHESPPAPRDSLTPVPNTFEAYHVSGLVTSASESPPPQTRTSEPSFSFQDSEEAENYLPWETRSGEDREENGPAYGQRSGHSEETHTSHASSASHRRLGSATSITSLGSSYRAHESDMEEDVLGEKRCPEEDELQASLTYDQLLWHNPNILAGLNIQDVAYMQQELVRSASARKQAQADYDAPQPSLSREAVGHAPRQASEDSNNTSTPQFSASSYTTPDMSSDHQEELTTPPDQLRNEAALGWSPSKGFQAHRCKTLVVIIWSSLMFTCSVDSALPVTATNVENRPTLQPKMSISELRGLSVSRSADEPARYTPVYPSAELPIKSPVVQTRAQPTNRSYANTNSSLIRSVGAQAEAATAALKNEVNENGDKLPLRRHKSNRSISTRDISAPHFLTSSANLSRLQDIPSLPDSPELPTHSSHKHMRKASSTANLHSRSLRKRDATEDAMPSLGLLTGATSPGLLSPSGSLSENYSPNFSTTPPMRSDSQLSSYPSSPLTPPPRTGSRQQHHQDTESKGLGKLLSRLRRKKQSNALAFPEPIPYMPFDLGSSSAVLPDQVNSASTWTSTKPSPTTLSERTRPLSPAHTRKPPRPTSPPPAHLNTIEFHRANTPTSPSSRAPTTYDVSGSWRKRSLSLTESKRSQGGSPLPDRKESFSTPSSPLSRGLTNSATAGMQPPIQDDVRDSIHQLMAAGTNLGIDTDKLNDLVKQVSNRSSDSSSQFVAIPEEQKEELVAEPDRRSCVIRRTIIFPASTLQQVDCTTACPQVNDLSPPTRGLPAHPAIYRQDFMREGEEHGGSESNDSEAADIQANVGLRSVHDRVPTPPPVHQRHSRTISGDILAEDPIPDLPSFKLAEDDVSSANSSLPVAPLALPSRLQGSAASTSFLSPPGSASPTLRSFRGASYTDSFLDLYGNDDTELIVAQGLIPPSADQSMSEEGHGEDSEDVDRVGELPQSQPGDRVEIDELGDGSLVSVIQIFRPASVTQHLITAGLLSEICVAIVLSPKSLFIVETVRPITRPCLTHLQNLCTVIQIL